MLSVSPAMAGGIDPVDAVDGPAGCSTNCPAPGQTSYLTGNAVSGNAENDQNGSGSSFTMAYTVPSDAQNSLYSGTYMIQIVDANNNVSVITGGISDYARGGYGNFLYGGAPVIPVGGSASLTINESNANGASFSAGYVVNNFGK